MRIPSLLARPFLGRDHGAVTLDWLALSSGLLLLVAALFASAADTLGDLVDRLAIREPAAASRLSETAVTVPVADRGADAALPGPPAGAPAASLFPRAGPTGEAAPATDG